MADPNNIPEFDDIKVDLGEKVYDPKYNSAATENGLSDWQRYVVKNVFDTQPARRKAYLKKYGYEMDKTGENYRPQGSNGNYQPIEPDNAFLGFIPVYKFWTKEGRDELQKDLKDVDFDTAVGAPLIGAGAAEMGSAGATAGGIIGKIIGGLESKRVAPALATAGGAVGAVAGGAAGNAAAEVIKTGIGDYLLEEHVPVDLEEAAYQSLTAGVLSGLGRVGGQVLSKWKTMKAKDVQSIMKEVAIRKSNGTWNQELANDLAKNPENYTPEAVKGATGKLLKLSDDIFGTSIENPKSTRELKGGIAKQAIDPLNATADLEIQKLSHNKEANFSVPEIIETMQDRIKSITGKKFKTQDEERALDFFTTEVENLKKKTLIDTGPPQSKVGPNGISFVEEELGPAKYKELNFKEGRDYLKRLQNAAYEEGPVKDNGVVKSLTHDLKELADVKAGAAGSDLPNINAQRSKMMNTYKNMQSLIRDGSMQSAFVGKDSIAKDRVRQMMAEADQVFNTELSPVIESTQFQAAVERLYNSPSSFGSGSVLKDMMKAGLDQAPKTAFKYGTLGGAAGKMIPGVGAARGAATGGAIGAVKGFAEGAKVGAAMSSPDTMINQFSKIKTKLSDLNSNPGIRAALAEGRVPAVSNVRNSLPVAGLVAQQVPPVSDAEKAAVRGEPTPAAAGVPPAQPGFDQPLQSIPEFQDVTVDLEKYRNPAP